jgi:hypothetical protein
MFHSSIGMVWAQQRTNKNAAASKTVNPVATPAFPINEIITQDSIALAKSLTMYRVVRARSAQRRKKHPDQTESGDAQTGSASRTGPFETRLSREKRNE